MAVDHPDFVDYQTFVFQGLLPCFSSYLSFFWDGDVAKELPVQVTTITTAQGGAQGEWAGVGGVGWGFHTLFWTQMAPQRLVPRESSPFQGGLVMVRWVSRVGARCLKKTYTTDRHFITARE